MRTFLVNLRNIAIAGFFFLLPVIVVLIIVTKAWGALTSVGAKLAAMFGMKTIVGLASTSVFTGLLLVVICIACGLLVRVTFVSALGNMVEGGWQSTFQAMRPTRLWRKRSCSTRSDCFRTRPR